MPYTIPFLICLILYPFDEPFTMPIFDMPHTIIFWWASCYTPFSTHTIPILICLILCNFWYAFNYAHFWYAFYYAHFWYAFNYAHFWYASYSVWPDLAIYWTLSNFLKPLATIKLPQSPPFLGNFCKGVKIIHFLVKPFLGNFYRNLAIFIYYNLLMSLLLYPFFYDPYNTHLDMPHAILILICHMLYPFWYATCYTHFIKVNTIHILISSY